MAASRAGVPVLPKNKKQLATLIEEHAVRESRVQQVKWSRWLLAWYYLNGYRRFKAIGKDGEEIHASDMREFRKGKRQEKKIAAKIGTFLKIVNDTVGTISGMDLAPAVKPGTHSLASKREAAGASVLLASATQDVPFRTAKRNFAFFQSLFGMAGVVPHVINDPQNGLFTDYEVINPRELLPFPSLGWNIEGLKGVIRRRVVPVEQLKLTYPGKVPSDLGKMKAFRQRTGEQEDPRFSNSTDTVSMQDRDINNVTSTTTSKDGAGSGQDYYDAVYVNELRLMGPNGSMERLVVTSGETVIYDQQFPDAMAFFDVGVARFYETGSFYGAGLFDSVFYLVRELESLVEDFVENVKNADKYPITVIPDGQIKERSFLTDTGQDLKMMTVKGDMSVIDGGQRFTPVMIKPLDSGDAPAQATSFLHDQLNRVSPVRDLIEEKGRIDSRAGMEFLQEEEQRSMQVPLQLAADAFTVAHRAACGMLVREAVTTDVAVPVGNLTLDLAGVVVDPRTSTVSFKENPIPNVARLDMGVRQEQIASKAIRKQNALEMLQVHGDLNRMLVYAFENGIDLEADFKPEQGAYETVVLNILTLYNDGVTPGVILPNLEAMRPSLQLHVLNGFMQSPTWALASSEVQAKFIQYKNILMQQMQGVMPPGVPDPLSPQFTQTGNDLAGGPQF